MGAKLLICVACCAFLASAASSMEARADSPPVLRVLERTTEPLLQADQPWEDFCIQYSTVLQIDGQWHMWYSSYDHNYRTDSDTYTCYATSNDGVHWEKPSLGLYSYGGSTENNILFYGTHGVSVFVDPSAPASERFKAVGVRYQQGQGWLIHGASSADGLSWNWTDTPMMNKNADTHNVCVFDRGMYRLYARLWSGPGMYEGQRMVGYSESTEFGNFPDPVEILRADPKKLDGNKHFYNSAIARVNDRLYLMFPSGLFSSGKMPVYAAFSRNGREFWLLDTAPLLEPGEGFDSEGIYAAPGLVKGDRPGLYWLYYSGASTPHDDNRPSKVRHGGGIGRVLLSVEDAD